MFAAGGITGILVTRLALRTLSALRLHNSVLENRLDHVGHLCTPHRPLRAPHKPSVDIALRELEVPIGHSGKQVGGLFGS